jgi:hypothetical protein
MTLDITQHPTTLRSWYRLTGILGLIGSVVLVLNGARLLEFLPDNDLMHVVALFATLFGLFALMGVGLRQHTQLGRVGTIGFVLNAAGLAGAFAIEFVLHAIFPALPKATIEGLVEGRAGTAFLLVSVVLATGVLIFGITTWRTHVFPNWTVAVYTIGLTIVAVGRPLPLPVYVTGLVIAAVGISGLSLALVRAASQPESSR